MPSQARRRLGIRLQGEKIVAREGRKTGYGRLQTWPRTVGLGRLGRAAGEQVGGGQKRITFRKKEREPEHSQQKEQ